MSQHYMHAYLPELRTRLKISKLKLLYKLVNNLTFYPAGTPLVYKGFLDK